MWYGRGPGIEVAGSSADAVMGNPLLVVGARADIARVTRK
jgi:hypothetical protein